MEQEQPDKPREGRAAIRQLARQRLNGKTPPPYEHFPADARQLIHELQVYQAELELQNEELMESRFLVEQSRNTFARLYESAPVAYFTLSHQGLITQCNQAGSALLGYPLHFLQKHSLLRFVAGTDRPAFSQFFGDLARAEGKQTCRVHLQPQQGQPRTVHLEGNRLAASGVYEYLVAAIDLTEREKAEWLIQQQGELADVLLESSQHCIGVFDTQGELRQGNPVLARELGVPLNQLAGKRLFDFFPPSYRPALSEALDTLLQGDRAHLYRIPYPGREGFFEAELIPLRHGHQGTMGGLLVARDVAGRLRQEEEKQQQYRTQQRAVMDAVLLAQQAERKRISESLHNGVGQILYAAKLNLEKLPPNAGAEGAEAFRATYATVTKLLEEAIRETRGMSHRLVPQMLENFGLEAALHEMVKSVTGPGLRVTFGVTGPPARLPKPLEGVLYRIAQELLQNLLKHARANEAALQLEHRPGAVRLTVRDNGCGFSVAQLRAANAGLGLRLIREQVDLLEGLLDIDTPPGGGTQVQIELPRPGPEQDVMQ